MQNREKDGYDYSECQDRDVSSMKLSSSAKTSFTQMWKQESAAIIYFIVYYQPLRHEAAFLLRSMRITSSSPTNIYLHMQ